MRIVCNTGTERVILADDASENGRRAAEAGHHELVRRIRDNGGKAASRIETHSMLALYHMARPTPVQDLSDLDQLLEKHELTVPKNIKRAVLVGTSRGPRANHGQRHRSRATAFQVLRVRASDVRWPSSPFQGLT